MQVFRMDPATIPSVDELIPSDKSGLPAVWSSQAPRDLPATAMAIVRYVVSCAGGVGATTLGSTNMPEPDSPDP